MVRRPRMLSSHTTVSWESGSGLIPGGGELRADFPPLDPLSSLSSLPSLSSLSSLSFLSSLSTICSGRARLLLVSQNSSRTVFFLFFFPPKFCSHRSQQAGVAGVPGAPSCRIRASRLDAPPLTFPVFHAGGKPPSEGSEMPAGTRTLTCRDQNFHLQGPELSPAGTRPLPEVFRRPTFCWLLRSCTS